MAGVRSVWPGACNYSAPSSGESLYRLNLKKHEPNGSFKIILVATIYLHIGHMKTGTTALQRFLAANREAFQDIGFFCPMPFTGGGAVHELARVLWREPVFEGPAELLRDETAQSLYQRINRQIEESGCERAILSSEDFSESGEESEIFCEAVRSHLADHDIRVIVYLRRQDKALEARYKQYVKIWREGKLMSFEEHNGGHNVDYLDALSPWAKVFGRENIIVRVYEKHRMPAGIQADFCKAIGVPFDGGFVLPADTFNPSMSSRAIRVIQKIKDIPMGPRLRKRVNFVVRRILDGEHGARIGNDPGLFTPRQRVELMDRFATSNAEIARIYQGRADGILFEDMPTEGA